MSETSIGWLRVSIGPGCTATILVSREPSAEELGMLIKFIQVAIDGAALFPQPTKEPPP